ncbi:MAG: hypothetical protein AAF572_02870 [Cyanobacteria bacterium P01_B01_bin.77]
MAKPEIPANAYTYAPKQHPNLIIGSLQLLFWLVFRPRAWENHLRRINSSFDKNVYLLQLFRNQRWQQSEVQRFLIQGFILLPILFSLFTGLVSWGLGTPLNEAIYGVALGVVFGVAFGVAGGIAFGIAIGIVVGVAFGVAFGMAFGVIVGGGLWVNLWRPIILPVILTPWHWLLYRFDKSRHEQLSSLLHKHLAFWDEWQYLPIPGLDKHLLLTLEKRPAEGQAALNFLSTGPQRWAAQAAQIELDARQLERYEDAATIGQTHQSLTIGKLQGPADTLLRSFARISNHVSAALSQESTYNQRLSLTSIADRLDRLVRELTRSSDKYAARFRPIAQRWGNIIELTIEDLAKESELRQEIDSPYIIGVPLNQQQAVFVGRTDISARIEQLLLDRRRPPLLLYGQRRTGKTSLLNNLGRLLPPRIAKSHTSCCNSPSPGR